MPLSAAEKQRRYREKLKNLDREGMKEKEHRRWHQRKAAGKIKVVSDMTPREQRLQRRMWKKSNESRAERRRSTNAITEESRQKVRGRREKRRDRSLAYRKIDSLEKEVSKLKNDCSKYRKRALRTRELLNKHAQNCLHMKLNNKVCEDSEDTPRKKARKMSHEPKVRRILKFHYSLVAQLKQRYASLLSLIHI